MASVSIPVIGTKEYRNAFNAFARDKGSNMAKLVRAALDKQYGEDMKPYLSFFDSDVNSDEQTVIETNKHA